MSHEIKDPILIPKIFSRHDIDPRTGEPYVYSKLSVLVKWCYLTLKFCETVFFEENEYIEINPPKYPENYPKLFFVSNEELSFQARLSLSSVKRAKDILRRVGLITTERVFILGADGKLIGDSSRVGYRLFDGYDIKHIKIDKPIRMMLKSDYKEYIEKKKREKSLKKKLGRSYKYKIESGYIYVMQFVGCYKIGFTKNCARMGEYTKLPYEPKYIIVKLVDDMRGVEATLHKMFENKRMRNGKSEWFQLTAEDLSAIEAYINTRSIKGKHSSYYYQYVEKS